MNGQGWTPKGFQPETGQTFRPKGFQEDEDAAPKPVAPDARAAPAGPSGLESAGRGALQGATFGFGDEGAGAITSLLQTGVNVLPGAVQRALDVVPAPVGEAYRFSRDEERRANTAAEEANPNAYLAGNVAGGVLTGKAVPTGQILKGGKLLARLGNAALSGAGQGAAYGLGRSEAELGEGEVGRAALDTALGGALGAAGGALGAAGGVLGERVASKGGALLEAIRQRAGRGVQEAVEAGAGGAGEGLAEAVKRRVAPMALVGAGGLLGGAEGAAAAGAIGSALGIGTGQSAKATLRELLQDPATRGAAWQVLQKAAGTPGPGAMGRAAGLLERLSPQATSRALSRQAIDVGLDARDDSAAARAEALRRRRR